MVEWTYHQEREPGMTAKQLSTKSVKMIQRYNVTHGKIRDRESLIVHYTLNDPAYGALIQPQIEKARRELPALKARAAAIFDALGDDAHPGDNGYLKGGGFSDSGIVEV